MKRDPIQPERLSTGQDHDDMVMDSMLRQFVNSEVQRFRFAEKINSAIRESESSELVAVQTDEQCFESELHSSIHGMGRGRLIWRYGQVAAIAGAIFLALWLPNRSVENSDLVAERDIGKSNLRRSTKLNGGSSTGETQIATSSQSLLESGDTSKLEVTENAVVAKSESIPLPMRGQLVLKTDADGNTGGSLKIVRAESTVDSDNATEERKSSIVAPDDTKDRPQETVVAQRIEGEQVEQVDATLFPTRNLNFDIEVVSRTKSAYVSINGEKVAKKIRCCNLAVGLKHLEPEISRRIRFIEPRVGDIAGRISYKSDEIRFGLDFENERQLRAAFTRICDRIEKFGRSSKRNLRNTATPYEFVNRALKKTDEHFRLWAKESLAMGNVSLEPDFESRSRFQRVISKQALERFAQSGFFKVPEPNDIYLPTTQLQFLDSENLRQDLAVVATPLDLFASKEEMLEFSQKFRGGGGSGDGARGRSREPLKDILKQRQDLQGLPIVMDDECHMDQQRAREMDDVSRTVGPILNRFDRFASRNVALHPTARRQMLESQIQNVKGYFSRMSDSPQALLTIDQMLQIEEEDLRIELVKLLEESRSMMSASLLASYAKFDLSPQVRILATSALSGFPRSFYREKLIDGMRYPWPEAAKNTAEALVRLNEIETIPVLVDMLKEPDPRRPIHRDGKYVKRELVAINHLKNCMLCHADSQSPRDKGQAPVPVWEQELPRTYYNFRSPGLLMARADITYMRQDFSVVQKVDDAKPWPEHQRFDYVVQDRKLSKQQYDQMVLAQTMDSNAYEQSIVFALRMLTGKRPADNSYESWSAIVEKLDVLP